MLGKYQENKIVIKKKLNSVNKLEIVLYKSLFKKKKLLYELLTAVLYRNFCYDKFI